MAVTLYPGDNRETLKRLIEEGIRVHSVVTDPPYGLVSIEKRFKTGAAAKTEGNDGSFGRLSGGFMGKMWDGTGIERDPEFWSLIYDILLPGGYVFAFSSSRTGHWQACAMETAGFVMHPMHGWVFGSGFPKYHAADKAIDKKLKRPATPEAEQWQGWAYGTQSQKPALEPIYLGQKPFSEKTGAENLMKHGVGAVNIDGCRVPLKGESTVRSTGNGLRGRKDGWGMEGGVIGGSDQGRFPSNLILDGSPEVVELFPESKGAQGDVKGTEPSGITNGIYGEYQGRVAQEKRNDSGSAARFFHNFDLTEADYRMALSEGRIGETSADCVIYNAKASKADREGSKHPTVKPIALMQYLVRHITPPGGTVLDPFAGSGSTGVAAMREGFDCILMEAEPEYIEFLEDRFSNIENVEDFFN